MENSYDNPVPVESTPCFSFLFHHEGPFRFGTTIVKGFSWGEESSFVVDQAATGDLVGDFLNSAKTYEEKLPQQDFFANGLSRAQAAQVLAAQETIFRFNGCFSDEHSLDRNAALYESNDERKLALSEFRGKGALTCVESSALAQQLLATTQEMTYVSGSADLDNIGEHEMHSFNLIRPADPKYAVAILDIANPIYVPQPDGTFQVKLYCAPLTPEQFEKFKKNKAIELNFGGCTRSYQFGTPGGTKPVW